jgi:excinuclease ABC subunit C
MQYLQKDLTRFPESPGVYFFWSKNTRIYIGKALNLKNRLASYFDLHLERKTAAMVSTADKITFIRTSTELEALLLEAYLINKYQPRYNIIAKDDKHALYIRITKETYPRILTARKIEVNEPNLAFYGPFPSTGTVYSVLKMLRRIFPYSDHKIGKRACFYHHLGLCNPCPNLIKTKSETEEYRKNIFQIKKILSGNSTTVANELKKQMLSYSRDKKYEQASAILKKIKSLDYISQPISDIHEFLKNPNFLEDQRRREITDLQSLLKISHPLSRIECFDVAHLAGLNATASQVTFIDGEPDKTLYRTFRIRQTKSQDDIASLTEVAKRRQDHLTDWGRPDLIIVDGGKTQVKAFFTIFAPEKIPVVGLAKKRETLIFPDNREYILPTGPVRNLMQRIRNEAHRFAQKYHHRLMQRSLM